MKTIPALSLVVFLLTVFLNAKSQTVTLVPESSTWKYSNTSGTPGAGWKSRSYNDAAWPEGNAEFGYGDGGETTVLSFGTDPNKKFISYYFRKSFSITNRSAYSGLTLRLICDDGAVIYLNGKEVVRYNMPAGKIGKKALASSDIAGAAENTWLSFTIPVSSLKNGNNTFAIEVHQFATNSPDISFNLSLSATPLSSCGTPTGLSSSGITFSGATITWSAVSGASSYNIQYKQQSASNWTNTTSITNSKTLSGLSTNTAYQFMVQAVCNGTTGSFSTAATFTTSSSVVNDSLTTSNAVWKYLDNGSNQGTAWRAISFNDASWASGQAELGYGDGDEKTVLGYGPDANNRYITTYFRRAFNISNPSVYTFLKLRLLRDDGAVVYLNGTEVFRSNLPSGTISYTTLASSAIGGTDESTWYTAMLNPSNLIAGTNVIAVELHQSAASSSDISFNLNLFASSISTAMLLRGPYLNTVVTNRITIRWRTDIPTNSKVSFGTSLSYSSSVTDAALVTDHIVTLTGLTANTFYYYTIGSADQQLQGDANNRFKTAPATGSTAPIRIWATGDFGNGSTAQMNVRNAFQTYTASSPATLWLWLGDNAYETGTDAEYQSKVFNIYPNQFKSIPVYPSLGNHDYAEVGYQNAQALTTNFPYFDIFTLPTSAQAGGVASGTEKYYSYNYGNIHFIVLDSYGALNTPGSPMYTWLQNDLNANTQRWLICYWHHPPYTKGSHNSDTEKELIDMRQNILPLLESYHADVVLCGHSHFNERSYFIRGHYGTSGTFTSSMKMSSSNNRFVKSSSSDGCVYVNCGTSGQAPSGPQSGGPMPCMVFSNGSYNSSLVIDVAGDSLNCKFLASTGIIADEFSIVKQGTIPGIASIRVESQIDPNPVNDKAFITAQIPLNNITAIKPAHFYLRVTDVMGRQWMANEIQPEYVGKTNFRFAFEAGRLPRGIYLYQISSINGKHFITANGKFMLF